MMLSHEELSWSDEDAANFCTYVAELGGQVTETFAGFRDFVFTIVSPPGEGFAWGAEHVKKFDREQRLARRKKEQLIQ